MMIVSHARLEQLATMRFNEMLKFLHETLIDKIHITIK